MPKSSYMFIDLVVKQITRLDSVTFKLKKNMIGKEKNEKTKGNRGQLQYSSKFW